jgi:hypothetical protein
MTPARTAKIALLAVAAVTVGIMPARAALPPDRAVAPCAAGTTPICPSLDPFYQAPKDIASLANGTVIRSRPATINADGVPLTATGTTVIYKSTNIDGRPVADSTTILVPTAPFLGKGRRPLVSYQSAYDSLGGQCEPSYAMQHPTNQNVDLDMTAMESALALGWELTVPDYEGPDEELAIGPLDGRAVLDGIKATENFGVAGISRKSHVALWGYSGGGLASAWATELQRRYAPHLDIVGSAEGGVLANIKAVLRNVNGGVFMGLGLAGVVGASRAFPQAHITRMLNPAGRKLFASIRKQCVNSYLAQYIGKKLSMYTKLADPIDLPAFRPVFRALHLQQHVPMTAIYNYQETNDEIIPYWTDRKMVAWYCHRGVVVDHVPYATADHISLAVEGAPAALLWLKGRFAGRKSVDTCGH